jgi:hypothetical protein
MSQKEIAPSRQEPTPQSPDPDWDLPPLKMDYIEEGAVRRPSTITRKYDKSVPEEK